MWKQESKQNSLCVSQLYRSEGNVAKILFWLGKVCILQTLWPGFHSSGSDLSCPSPSNVPPSTNKRSTFFHWWRSLRVTIEVVLHDTQQVAVMHLKLFADCHLTADKCLLHTPTCSRMLRSFAKEMTFKEPSKQGRIPEYEKHTKKKRDRRERQTNYWLVNWSKTTIGRRGKVFGITAMWKPNQTDYMCARQQKHKPLILYSPIKENFTSSLLKHVKAAIHPKRWSLEVQNVCACASVQLSLWEPFWVLGHGSQNIFGKWGPGPHFLTGP